MKPVLFATLLATVAAPALAEPSAAEIDTFVAAVEQIGCIVQTDAQASAIEAATGFNDAKLAEIVAVLLADGRAVVPASAEGLRLTTEACT
ncbi:hypothetical protein [Rhodobaculum claviforme]|uniref:Uncharacterized protein n=1 Tax=Rhodobaculum claviforme TaxID=1549854 RepID=A0A934WKE8_9RHOB|nr:hypothetical protein [Rhodobaculum claviforme]MBK5928907.1 hypothetical protein [Rhodobaculum claviforme]